MWMTKRLSNLKKISIFWRSKLNSSILIQQSNPAKMIVSQQSRKKFSIKSSNNQIYFNYTSLQEHLFIDDFGSIFTLINFRGSPISRFTLSLFMVVLYYYYLSNEQDFLIDQHKILTKKMEDDVQKNENIELIELNSLVKLFEQIFMKARTSRVLFTIHIYIQNELNKSLYQSFVSSTNDKCKSNFHLTQFKMVQLIYDSSIFRTKLASIMAKNIQHSMTFGETIVQQSTQKKQSNPSTSPQPRDKTPKISKHGSQKSPSTKSFSFMSQQEKSTQTFRPTMIPEQTQTKTDSNIPASAKLVDEPLSTKIHDLEKKFKKIVREQLDQYSTSQWIRELHVKRKYRQLSPQSMEMNYKEALNKLFLDKLEQLSTEELMVYYDFMLKRARSLYVTFLREKKIQPQPQQS